MGDVDEHGSGGEGAEPPAAAAVPSFAEEPGSASDGRPPSFEDVRPPSAGDLRPPSAGDARPSSAGSASGRPPPEEPAGGMRPSSAGSAGARPSSAGSGGGRPSSAGSGGSRKDRKKKPNRKLPRSKIVLDKQDSLAVYDTLKDRAAVALIVVCFMEFMGSSMPAVSNPYLFLSTNRTSVSEDEIAGGFGRYSMLSDDIGYSVAIQIGTSAFYLGQGLFTSIAGCFIGCLGFRATMVTCCVLAAGAYFGIFAFSYWDLKYTFDDTIPIESWTPTDDESHWWYTDIDVYLFFGLRFAAGLFAGCVPLSRRYLKDIFGGRWEGDWWFSAVSVATLPAAIVAPIMAEKALNFQSEPTEKEYFIPYLTGSACYGFAALVIIFFVPRTTRKEWKNVQGDWKDQDADVKAPKESKVSDSEASGSAPEAPPDSLAEQEKKEKKKKKKKKRRGEKKGGHSKWVWWFWLARLLADIGAGHFTHLQAVGMFKYEWFRDDYNYSMVIASASGAALLAIPLGVILGSSSGSRANKACGALWAGFFGQALAGAALYGMTEVTNEHFYMLLLMGCSFANSLSKSQASQVLMDLVPADREDWWLSRMSLVQGISMAIAPFPLTLFVLESEEWGPFPSGCTVGQADCFVGYQSGDPLYWQSWPENYFLYACAIAAGASGVMHFIMLIKTCCAGSKIGPRPPDEEAAIQEYGKTADPRWLPGDFLLDQNLQRLEKGEPMLRHRFGNFEDDRPYLHRIAHQGRRDMKFWLSMVPQWVQDWDMADEDEQESQKLMLQNAQATYYMTEDERDEFADWMLDWLEFAGYGNPAQNPMCWKAMIMKVFPFVVEEGLRNPDFINKPIPIWLKWMKVMQDQLKLDDRNDRARHSLSLMGRGHAGSVLRLQGVF